MAPIINFLKFVFCRAVSTKQKQTGRKQQAKRGSLWVFLHSAPCYRSGRKASKLAGLAAKAVRLSALLCLLKVFLNLWIFKSGLHRPLAIVFFMVGLAYRKFRAGLLKRLLELIWGESLLGHAGANHKVCSWQVHIRAITLVKRFKVFLVRLYRIVL